MSPQHSNPSDNASAAHRHFSLSISLPVHLFTSTANRVMEERSMLLSNICRKIVHRVPLTDSFSKSVYHHSCRNENFLSGLSLSRIIIHFLWRKHSTDLNRWHWTFSAQFNRPKHAFQVILSFFLQTKVEKSSMAVLGLFLRPSSHQVGAKDRSKTIERTILLLFLFFCMIYPPGLSYYS